MQGPQRYPLGFAEARVNPASSERGGGWVGTIYIDTGYTLIKFHTHTHIHTSRSQLIDPHHMEEEDEKLASRPAHHLSCQAARQKTDVTP